jgi:hypothetical protein
VLTAIFAFSFVNKTEGAYPGFKTTLSIAGLKYVKDVGIQLLEQQLQSLTIADISGEAGNI